MSRRLRALSRFAALGACMGVMSLGSPLAAAKKEKKENAPVDDRAPVLVSRTGGDAWSDVKELKAAADQGNVRALAQLGDMKLRGELMEKDLPGGLTLLERAARAGHGPAAFRLGKTYDDGLLVGRDRARAFAYYRAAAAAGEAEAFFNLGASYSSGRGVPRDYAEGLAWMILARKRGVGEEGERRIRAAIGALKRPEMITRGEQRAVAIAAELAGAKPEHFLPSPAGVSPTPTPLLRPTPLAPVIPPPRATIAPPPVVAPPKPIVPDLPPPRLPSP